MSWRWNGVIILPVEEYILQPLSPDDGHDIYEMLQRIGSNENEFKNDVYGMSFDQYRQWLLLQSKWAMGIDLPDGYVAQSIFWLYYNNEPVGMGKLRHALTDASRNAGGNLGYAIARPYRGRGFGVKLAELLAQKAKELGIDEVLATVEKYNPASKRVLEKAGGVLVAESPERWYIRFY